MIQGNEWENEYLCDGICVVRNSVKREDRIIKLKSRVLERFSELCQSYWIVQIAIQINTI